MYRTYEKCIILARKPEVGRHLGDLDMERGIVRRIIRE
jgi:hypothetical protein